MKRRAANKHVALDLLSPDPSLLGLDFPSLPHSLTASTLSFCRGKHERLGLPPSSAWSAPSLVRHCRVGVDISARCDSVIAIHHFCRLRKSSPNTYRERTQNAAHARQRRPGGGLGRHERADHRDVVKPRPYLHSPTEPGRAHRFASHVNGLRQQIQMPRSSGTPVAALVVFHSAQICASERSTSEFSILRTT